MPSGALKYGSFVSPKVNAKLHCLSLIHILYDFCKRLRGGGLNRRALENLVKAGACLLYTSGLERRYPGKVTDALRERLTYEINVVKTMGYTNYYPVSYTHLLFWQIL